ncbi:MAG: hypothetical protein NTZ09_21865 [Candidatus Hydrogenedentes bacterium]|nr:hypothetical protein [Candidatus Hydrogenedentota bacterium]
MGIPQTKLMDGVEAPKRWAEGKHLEVMDYCLGDCQIANSIVLAIQDKQRVHWITRKGTVGVEAMPELKCVQRVIVRWA